uniref:AN1-type domain-containing protein n=1 Tax=Strigamia maritima TaxID=126957 RepID=T1IXA3_STRMM
MERDTNQMQQATFCRSGCGFYGSPATDGLCSKCYKDALKRKQSTPPVTGRISPSGRLIGGVRSFCPVSVSGTAPSTSTALPEIASINTATPTVPVLSPASSQESQIGQEKCLSDTSIEASASSSDCMDTEMASDAKDSPQKDKKKKNRCQTCRKKIGLTGFECRCGGLFCSLHRYSDKHDCTFDYKELGAQEIRKNNPVVVGEKIQKI